MVGTAAIAAPDGFTASPTHWSGPGAGSPPAQLWLNYAAFLPMPWLLLGIYAVRSE